MSGDLALETRDLCAFFGRTQVLDHLSLHAEEGRIYGFLGRNGAGKSTTIRIILRLLRSSSGKVTLFGEDLDTCYKTALRQVGSLVESPGFYDHLSGSDNLRIAQIIRGLEPSSIGKALELTGLSDVGRKPVGQYSMGMKQRLGLAWAMLGNPRLLILDEPINGLDPAGVREVRDLLRYLSGERKVTVFLSSHILSEVQQIAHRIGVIHQGRLVVEQDALGDDSGSVDIRIRCPEGAKAADMLKRIAWVGNVGCRSAGEVFCTVPRGKAGELNGLLVRSELAVEEFAWAEPDLEDYFLRLTGGVEVAKTAAC